jgi:peptide chain release factor 2
MRLGAVFDLDSTQKEYQKLTWQMESPDFWVKQEQAVRISRQAAEIKREIEEWEILQKEVEDLLELANEISQDQQFKQEEVNSDLLEEIEEQYQKLQERYKKLEFVTLFSGKFDERNAILAIHAGTGGVDAQDWTEMLLRMYLRYAEKQGFTINILDKQIGNEAGIKSVTLDIQGRYAYGFLKCEAGVHRLVRISPFDAEKMRHTSFALVEVLPDLGELEQIEIKEDDLRIDTFRSSGAGGQSVNKTDSAVRIVHLPTKITVSCQSERSQHQNKERALKILKAKLYQLEEQKLDVSKKALRGEYHEAKWGNQIRSYVLQPYQLVKDHRTNYETSDVESVLNGEIGGFVERYLMKIKNSLIYVHPN